MKLLFPNRAPDSIWYADKPIIEGGQPRKIKVADFMKIYQEKMHTSFNYMESICTDIQGEEYKSAYKDDHCFSNAVKRELELPSTDDIVICYVNKSVGFSAFARKDIPAYKLVAIYAGELVRESDKRKSDYSHDLIQIEHQPGNEKYCIDANHNGGLSRFFCHLPFTEKIYDATNDSVDRRVRFLKLIGSKDSVKTLRGSCQIDLKRFENLVDRINKHKIAFSQIENDYVKIGHDWRLFFNLLPEIKNLWQTYCATEVPHHSKKMTFNEQTWHLDSLVEPSCVKVLAKENLERNATVINGNPVVFFYASRNIQAGNILGFDYGLGYWVTKQTIPLLFNRQGVPLSFETYKYSRIMISSNNPSSSDRSFFCTLDEYNKNIETQMPIQIQFSGRPVSFFSVRDIFVDNNLLPASHKALDDLQPSFVSQLKHHLARIKGVVVKAYYQNPNAPIAIDRETVCVVCRFDDYKHWDAMRGLVKKHAVSANCKSYQFSQEIIFRDSNINIKVMRDFILYLYSQPLLRNSLSTASSPKIFGRCYIKSGDSFVVV